MKRPLSAVQLAEEILQGSERALSRGLTAVEQRGDLADALLDRLYSHTGHAHVVGLTGSPGSGKSTLARALAREARTRGMSVGIIAIDPSSPFSGGSILGDRVRMNDIACATGIFIRSLATHGALGGLSRAAGDLVDVMDAAGRQLIIVETVGVGQDEVDVMATAHTVAVVSVPGLGDEIQTLKAGILEIADIHVVNKADRTGADLLHAELSSMLAFDSPKERPWHPPIVRCVALREEGIASLFDVLVSHMQVLRASGEFDRRRARMIKSRLLGIAHDMVRDATERETWDSDDLIKRVARRELAPRAAGKVLLSRLVNRKGDASND